MTAQQTKTEAGSQREKCIHHWFIESAKKGRPSMGTCSKCRVSRRFSNTVPSRGKLSKGPGC